VIPILLVVLVIIGSGVGIGLLYEHNNPKSPTPIRTVQLGDNVTVDYTGSYATGPQTGRVFDTSLYSVETNNLTFPKSLQFHACGAPAQCVPIGFHVGPSAPSGGYVVSGESFLPPVTGFWQGLIGLPVGKAGTISIPPALGYGSDNAACFVTLPLSYTVAVLRPVAEAAFATEYPGVTATPGTEFTDPTFSWNDLVLSTNATSVVIENLPPVGWSVPSNSWPLMVTNVSATAITLRNELAPSQAGLVQGKASGSGLCSSQNFIVSAVNTTANTFTENYNREVQGQTLVFVVSVVRFY